MNIKRVLATGMAALMAGSTLAIGGLGQGNATSPTATPAAAASTGATTLAWTIADSADSWITYVGADASGGSVVHAKSAEAEVLAFANGLDLKTTTFADAITKTRTTTGDVKPATGSGVTTVGGGTSKDLNFGASATTGGTLLTAGVNAFPTGAWSNSVVPQLKSGKVSWESTDYDWKETFSATGVRMRNDVGTDNINGTLTMEVETSDVSVNFQFDKAINISTANGKGMTETSSFETTKPIEITFLGKKFQIIGMANNKMIVLNGAIGKSITETSGLEYTTAAGKKYTVYVTEASDNTWARVVIKDSTGAQVGTASITKGSAENFDSLDLTIEVTAVKATQANKPSGVDLVVGPKGKVKKTIDTSADVTSTGTSNDALFEGYPDWGLQTSSGANDFITGNAPANAQLQLVYKPSTTKYYKAGQELKAPGNIRLLNNGFNTNTFAKVTFAPISGISPTNTTTGSTSTISNLAGIEISSDVANTVGGAGGIYYTKMAVLFGQKFTAAQRTAVNELADSPVYIAYHDGSGWKANGSRLVLVGNLTTASNLNAQGVDSVFALVNSNNTDGSGFNYTFALNYGGSSERTWYVNTSVGAINNAGTGGLNSTTTPIRMILGRNGATGDTTARYGINLTWENKSVWTNGTTYPEFRLGTTTSSEDRDVYITTEATAESAGQAVGKKSQTLLDNSGLQIENPASTTASDKVVVLLPNKEVQANVFVGAQSGTGTPSFSTPAEVAAQARAGTLAKNLILVGGPCANEVVEYLAGTSATDSLPTCQEWVGGATPKYTKGLIGVWAVGTKKALVIAGTMKTDTDALAGDFGTKGVTATVPA